MQRRTSGHNRWTLLSTATMVMLFGCSGGCGSVKSCLTEHGLIPIARHHKYESRYHHVSNSGQLIPKDGLSDCHRCFPVPMYHGYEPTCWRQWPQGWGCPPEAVANNPEFWRDGMLESDRVEELPAGAAEHEADLGGDVTPNAEEVRLPAPPLDIAAAAEKTEPATDESVDSPEPTETKSDLLAADQPVSDSNSDLVQEAETSEPEITNSILDIAAERSVLGESLLAEPAQIDRAPAKTIEVPQVAATPKASELPKLPEIVRPEPAPVAVPEVAIVDEPKVAESEPVAVVKAPQPKPAEIIVPKLTEMSVADLPTEPVAEESTAVEAAAPVKVSVATSTPPKKPEAAKSVIALPKPATKEVVENVETPLSAFEIVRRVPVPKTKVTLAGEKKLVPEPKTIVPGDDGTDVREEETELVKSPVPVINAIRPVSRVKPPTVVKRPVARIAPHDSQGPIPVRKVRLASSRLNRVTVTETPAEAVAEETKPAPQAKPVSEAKPVADEPKPVAEEASSFPSPVKRISVPQAAKSTQDASFPTPVRRISVSELPVKLEG